MPSAGPPEASELEARVGIAQGLRLSGPRLNRSAAVTSLSAAQRGEYKIATAESSEQFHADAQDFWLTGTPLVPVLVPALMPVANAGIHRKDLAELRR